MNTQNAKHMLRIINVYRSAMATKPYNTVYNMLIDLNEIYRMERKTGHLTRNQSKFIRKKIQWLQVEMGLQESENCITFGYKASKRYNGRYRWGR